MIGYYRNNCSEKCSPPNYGEDCQSVCQCPDIDCHFVTGCFQNTGTLTYHWQLSIVISSFYNNYVNTPIPVLDHTLIHMKQLNTIFASFRSTSDGSLYTLGRSHYNNSVTSSMFLTDCNSKLLLQSQRLKLQALNCK